MSDIKFSDDIVMRDIEEIYPYENNPRINILAVDALVDILPKVGFNVPIVIDRNGVIVKGHSRYMAAKRLGWKALPCIIHKGTDREIEEERILDNKIAEKSKWRESDLEAELRACTITLGEVPDMTPKDAQELFDDVSEGDIAKAEKDLDKKAKPKDMRRIVCENCGEEFFLNEKEIKRFADEN